MQDYNANRAILGCDVHLGLRVMGPRSSASSQVGPFGIRLPFFTDIRTVYCVRGRSGLDNYNGITKEKVCATMRKPVSKQPKTMAKLKKPRNVPNKSLTRRSGRAVRGILNIEVYFGSDSPAAPRASKPRLHW